MYQSLESIFAVFGIGCFLAGIIVASIFMWAYRELKKDDAHTGQELSQQKTGKIVAFRGRDDNLV